MKKWIFLFAIVTAVTAFTTIVHYDNDPETIKKAVNKSVFISV